MLGPILETMIGGLFTGEQLPQNGKLKLGTAAGFGMELADRAMLVEV